MCLPYPTIEESSRITSSEESPSTSCYTTAVNISADDKIPPPANPLSSTKNLKRLLFSSSSSSESETGEEEIIILHSSENPFGKARTVHPVRVVTISADDGIPSPVSRRPAPRVQRFIFSSF
ncbi:hypothetical protein NPIL_112021 [Nephila pilipes]|uniref:Uncharacterized protein n=1 Tax=Nephila pilipes TaxID=299642 RepID=A0A8X6TSB2_NEPPI|nr:hypothetical protein NPIL_112021 [Nephila pilipes]